MRNLSQEFDFNPKFDFGRKKLRSQISAANGMHIGTVGRCLRLWTTLKRNKGTLMLMRGHLLMLMTNITQNFWGFSKGWPVRIAIQLYELNHFIFSARNKRKPLFKQGGFKKARK